MSIGARAGSNNVRMFVTGRDVGVSGSELLGTNQSHNAITFTLACSNGQYTPLSYINSQLHNLVPIRDTFTRSEPLRKTNITGNTLLEFM